MNIDGDVIAPVYLQYARRLSDVQATVNRVRLFLALGVLGGALLALLAGLATARRAMEPISELTAAARRVARTRDPSVRMPRPEADDEVAELARTLEAMLGALNEAREETEATLDRQREFVADASHELRTPLTSVLANLELLEEELERRAARGGRVRAALVATDAPAGRRPAAARPRRRRARRAAPARRPLRGGHRRGLRARAGRRRPRDLRRRGAAAREVEGARDELHRLVLNLMENALRHTDPGTAVEASVERRDGEIVLSVEDDGPGIPVELERQGLRALLPRRGRPQRIERPRALDRARGGRLAPRQRAARAAARRPRRALRRAAPGAAHGRDRPRGEHRLTAHSSRGPRGRFPGGHVRDVRPAARRLLARGSRSTRSRSAPCTRSSASPSPAPWRPRPTGSAASSACAARSSRSSTSAPGMALATGDREPGKIVIVETGTSQVGVMVDDVEEVLTVTSDQLEPLPTAGGEVDRGDRQDRGPPGDPAQRRRSLRAPRGRGPRGGRLTRRLPESHAAPSASASSSPTTRG